MKQTASASPTTRRLKKADKRGRSALSATSFGTLTCTLSAFANVRYRNPSRDRPRHSNRRAPVQEELVANRIRNELLATGQVFFIHIASNPSIVGAMVGTSPPRHASSVPLADGRKDSESVMLKFIRDEADVLVPPPS